MKAARQQRDGMGEMPWLRRSQDRWTRNAIVAAAGVALLVVACSPSTGGPGATQSAGPAGGPANTGDLEAASAAFVVDLWLTDLSSRYATEDGSKFLDMQIQNPEWRDHAAKLSGGAEVADTLQISWQGGWLQAAGDGTYVGHKTTGKVELNHVTVEAKQTLPDLSASDKANGITFRSVFWIDYAARTSQRYFEPANDTTGDPNRDRVDAWLRASESVDLPELSSWFDGRYIRTVGLKDGHWTDLTQSSSEAGRCFQDHVCYLIGYSGKHLPFRAEELDRFRCVNEKDAPNYEVPPPCLITTVGFGPDRGFAIPTPVAEVRVLGANEALNVRGAKISITRPSGACDGFSFALRIENPTMSELAVSYLFDGGQVWGGGEVSPDCYPNMVFDGAVEVGANGTVEVGFRDVDLGPTVIRVAIGTGEAPAWLAVWSLEH